MWDIYLGIVIMVSVSVLFFAFTVMVAKRFPRRLADTFAIFALIGMCLYIYLLWDKAEVTWFVPYSNAIIVGNWFPIITAVLSGLVYHRIPGRKKNLRRYGFVALLNFVGVYAMVQPVLGSPPHCENKQEFKFAIQTSQVSCSPTSAVNLLKFYDVQATESEMARLCLTRESRSWLGFRLAEGGTSWLGLYRGLKLKLQDTDFEPIFFSMSFERFLEESGRGRLITALKLRSSLEQENPEQFQYLREGGWQPEVEHNVVFLGIEKDVVSLIDPKVGYEEMDLKDFRELWVGRGIFLEKK